MKKRANILTIAGFDPSGGAGILADIKTFEANSTLGFAVQTANTIQTEDKFSAVNWIKESVIIEQLQFVLAQYTFHVVKIGLIPSLDLLNQVIDCLKKANQTTKIIWDPILAVSAGFDFKHDLSNLETVLQKIYLLTPNWNEMQRIGGSKDAYKLAEHWSEQCKIYLKGGHNEKHLGKDYLFAKGKSISFNPKQSNYTPKHGSGCVFSAALAANLAKGYPEQKAVLRAKRYVEKFLKSNLSLLGFHYG